MKKLAVIMPTYNNGRFISCSVNSILQQTFSDFHLYIFDDGSDDDTHEVISQINDARIFYSKSSTNQGLSKTLNMAVDSLMCNYEYIARMDADDWAFPQRFEKQLNFLESNQEYGICGTQGFWLKNLDEVNCYPWTYPTEDDKIKIELLFTAAFGHSSLMIRSNVMVVNSVNYSTNLESTEDWDLWIKMSKVTRLYNLSDFLMKYRVHSQSNHRNINKIKRHYLERAEIIANYWNFFMCQNNGNVIFNADDISILYYSNETNCSTNSIDIKSVILKLVEAINIISKSNEQYYPRLGLQLLRIMDKTTGISTLNKFRIYLKLEKKCIMLFFKRELKRLV